MDVLLVGSDNPVGVALQAAFSHWGRHRALLHTAAASRWRSERQAKKAARRGEPQAIVDLRVAWQLSAGEEVTELDTERSHWLAKACERSGMHYLLVSSDRVFAGMRPRGLREDDEPDARDEVGLTLAEMERRVIQASRAALILRMGPLFASVGANVLTHTLETMAEEETAVFDDRDIFCPVASLDAARVIAAVLDQIGVGAPASGVFHYCSGDKATAYGFAEAALAAAGQYSDCGDVVIAAKQHDEAEPAPVQRVLECSRLRDAFAIKQVPWRGFMNTMVQQKLQYAQQQKEPH